MRALVTIAALVALTVACGGGNTPTSPSLPPSLFGGSGGFTPLSRGTLRATVDGQPWQSTSPILYFYVGPGDRFTVFGESGPGPTPMLSVSGPLAVGTYSANGLDNRAIFILAQPPITWSVDPFGPASSATLTVTAASRTRVAGTFAFTGVPGSNAAGAAPRVVTNGAFDVSQ